MIRIRIRWGGQDAVGGWVGSNTIIYILHYFQVVKLSTPTYKYSEYSEYCAHLYSSKIHFNYIFNYIYKIDVT